MGSFGNARGSGLSRGKRPAPAAVASAAPAANVSTYKPTSVAVITPQREYTHPFVSEAPAAVPTNEPAPQAEPAPAPTPAPASVERDAPATPAKEMFPFNPTAATEPKPSSPQPQPERLAEKAEIKILPPEEARRPAVSWGAGTHDEDTRPHAEPRPTFRSEPREPRSAEPREPRPFQPREPRREPFQGQRSPRDDREPSRPETPAKSGGFIAWLKGLFGGKPAAPAPSQPVERDGNYRDGEHHGHRRRHRGGRGRGGYQGDNRSQGENRGPRDGQFRDQSPSSSGPGQSEDRYQQQGERRFEGGGRRRRRGGRGRYRGEGGGPGPEGQQGGGAI